MNCWTKRNLGDALLADPAIASTEKCFVDAYNKAGMPANMAAFIRHESEGRLHCEVIVYFSPSAAAIAQKLGATPCPKPATEGLSLLAGDRNYYLR